MIKTRVQTWDLAPPQPLCSASQPLLGNTAIAGEQNAVKDRPSTWAITKQTYHKEGMQAFFRGLGICSARAFIVNAVQWAVSKRYHSSLKLLKLTKGVGIRVDDGCAICLKVPASIRCNEQAVQQAVLSRENSSLWKRTKQTKRASSQCASDVMLQLSP